MASTVRINPNLAADYARSQDAKDLLEATVPIATDVAISLVPRLSGDLADSIEGAVGLTSDGWLGRINAHAYNAHFVEFGTVHHPAQPFLRPIADVLGLELRDPGPQ